VGIGKRERGREKRRRESGKDRGTEGERYHRVSEAGVGSMKLSRSNNAWTF
jgi:hypothetical protein